MSQLLITLTPPGADRSELAYAVATGAEALASHGHAAPALLPPAAQATLIVPPQALSWHAAQLPKLPRGSSAQKQQAVLAGVLEEQLLDDTASLHLVASPLVTEDGRTWVAACDKAWLTEQLQALRAAQVPLVSIVPQFFPSTAGGTPASFHASGTPESAWLTTIDAQGVLTLPLQQAAWLVQQLPEGVNLSAEPAVAALAEKVWAQRANVVQAPQLALQAVLAAKAQSIELARGAFALSGGGRAWQTFTNALRDVMAAPAWRPARFGFALLLLAHVVGLNAWAWKQSTAAGEKRAQMNQLLAQSFPNVKVIVDAPLQMQRELANLRQQQGQLSSRDFESIYGRFSALTPVDIAPSAIEFIANEVRIKGTASGGEQLNALMPRLQLTGLDVRSESRGDGSTWVVSHRDALSSQPLAKPQGKP